MEVARDIVVPEKYRSGGDADILNHGWGTQIFEIMVGAHMVSISYDVLVSSAWGSGRNPAKVMFERSNTWDAKVV